VRLILDGTVVRVRLDRKATSISLLVALGVRADGQKVLLAIRSMGGESAEAWRAVLDDLIKRGLRRPEFLIVDGAPGLDKAIAAVWDGVPVQRCTVHKHRNLLAHAPERLHEEITADYTDMMYAATAEEIEARRKAFIRKWRLKHRAVADSLEEAGERLFAFTRLPPSQWRSARTTNAIERLHEEFKRRIKTHPLTRASGIKLSPLWSMSMWSLLPIIWFSPKGAIIISYLGRNILALAVAVPLMLVLVSPVVAIVIHRVGNVNPAALHGHFLAKQVERLWEKTTHQPLRFVDGDEALAYEVAAYAKDEPRVLPGMPPENLVALARSWRALVCFADSPCAKRTLRLAARVPSSKQSEVEVERDYLGAHGAPVRYLIVIIPPKGTSD
jgi:Transposase, Mutator family